MAVLHTEHTDIVVTSLDNSPAAIYLHQVGPGPACHVHTLLAKYYRSTLGTACVVYGLSGT